MMLTGAPKVWIGVPGSQKEKLLTALKGKCPQIRTSLSLIICRNLKSRVPAMITFPAPT
jgi:hypothetical protein